MEEKSVMSDFHWGNYENGRMKEYIIREMNDLAYEKFYKVNDGDVVMDVGASVGPFIYSLCWRSMNPVKPKVIYAIEPLESHHELLIKNSMGMAQIIPVALSSDREVLIEFGELSETCKGMKFKEIIKTYGISHIDFLKIDCEGGEYEIFNQDNINWLIKNVKYCVGEWHLENQDQKDKFRMTRDLYFHVFKHLEVYSVDGINIKWDLYNDHFIEYYNDVIIHIEL